MIALILAFLAGVVVGLAALFVFFALMFGGLLR